MKMKKLSYNIFQVRELIKDSGIYINKNSLTNAVNTNNKQTTLARALMQAVFTDEALKTCTLRGKSGKRPGLDQDGVNAILGTYLNFL